MFLIILTGSVHRGACDNFCLPCSITCVAHMLCQKNLQKIPFYFCHLFSFSINKAIKKIMQISQVDYSWFWQNGEKLETLKISDRKIVLSDNMLDTVIVLIFFKISIWSSNLKNQVTQIENIAAPKMLRKKETFCKAKARTTKQYWQ